MRTAHTTARVMEAMAERYHLPIEMHDDTAYLDVNGVVWTAPLAPVSKR